MVQHLSTALYSNTTNVQPLNRPTAITQEADPGLECNPLRTYTVAGKTIKAGEGESVAEVRN